MNFMVSWQEQYITGERSERVRYCSCHKNIKFISSRLRAISSVSYGHVIDITKAWKELVRHFFSVSLKNDSRILIFFFVFSVIPGLWLHRLHYFHRGYCPYLPVVSTTKNAGIASAAVRGPTCYTTTGDSDYAS